MMMIWTPNEVASITLLKDGPHCQFTVSGANGVVVITTKEPEMGNWH